MGEGCVLSSKNRFYLLPGKLYDDEQKSAVVTDNQSQQESTPRGNGKTSIGSAAFLTGVKNKPWAGVTQLRT